jgi:mRNA interferase RelE/StbE
VKKLQGRDGYRLRVGDWRVIFDRDGVVLAILEIGPRGSIYED